MLNRTVWLNQNQLWFFGTDQDYWGSDVQYRSPGEIEQSPSSMLDDGEEYDAGKTTIGQIAGHLELDEGDRICYVFDYGDEWRFYGIIKEIDGDRPSDTQPEVVAEKGDPVDQYASPGDRL